jgi:hypothetical protein
MSKEQWGYTHTKFLSEQSMHHDAFCAALGNAELCMWSSPERNVKDAIAIADAYIAALKAREDGENES